MNSIEVTVKQRRITFTKPLDVVAGSVGIDTITATFDEEWDGLSIYVTFDGSGKIVTTEYVDGMEVPHECLAATSFVRLSFEGIGQDGKEVIHTGYMTKPISVTPYAPGNGFQPQDKTANLLDQFIATNAAAQEVVEAAARGDFKGERGERGERGEKGEPGRDGYTPVKNVDYFDGQNGYTPVFGVDYRDGRDGKDGRDGRNGVDGRDGYTPVKGVDYFDGRDGKDGKDGSNGRDGRDGYTPVKGVDYFDGDKGDAGAAGHTPTDAELTVLINAQGFAKTSAIPTDAHINELINAALGVIENGSY